METTTKPIKVMVSRNSYLFANPHQKFISHIKESGIRFYGRSSDEAREKMLNHLRSIDLPVVEPKHPVHNRKKEKPHVKMMKKYSIEMLRGMNDGKLLDILNRASANNLNDMFTGSYGLRKDRTPEFIEECFIKIRGERESYNYVGYLEVEYILPAKPTWDDIEEQADLYLTTIDPVGSAVGYNGAMLFKYLKANFHKPIRK